MDVLDLHQRALASTARYVRATPPDQLTLPTPCAGWDIRALLDHVIGGNHLYAEAARGEADWSRREGDWTGGTPVDAYDRSAAAVTAALATLDLAHGTLALPFGDLPAGFAVAIHFVDVLVHGWDLAVATGQDPALEADLATSALEVAGGYPDWAWDDDRFFAGRVAAPEGAPPHERLAALLGRTP